MNQALDQHARFADRWPPASAPELAAPFGHVVVVGGGIAGLSAAYRLRQRAREAGQQLRCTLIESSSRLGGKLVTEHVDGFVIEGGPDSFLSQKPEAADLCRQLGLGDELIGTNDARRTVFVVHRGRLERLPEGMQLIVPTRLRPLLASPLLSWPGKARMLLDLLIPARREQGDESLASFVGRRFGPEAVERLAEPLMSGIHAAEPERQSILGTFARFRDLEQKHGSLIRGTLAQRRSTRRATVNTAGAVAAGPQQPRSAFLTLRGGVERLVRALRDALVDVDLRLGQRVVELCRAGETWRLRLDGGDTLVADAVVLATPAYTSADLLAPLDPGLAAMLRSIRYVSTATVSLGFRRGEVEHSLDGFGFVVPRRERRHIFGCTWSSTKFDYRAPDQALLLRCFLGGSGHESQLSLSDDELIGLARDDLRILMGIRAEPIIARVYRWERSNPQYEVGHPQRVREIYRLCAEQPGLFVTGGVFEGVGIPDCVRHATSVADHAYRYLLRSASRPAVG